MNDSYYYYLANGPGHPGRYTKTRGFLSYYEVNIYFSCNTSTSFLLLLMIYLDMRTRSITKLAKSMVRI